MPIYEYRCRACGDTYEALRPAGEADAPIECACGRTDTTRIPSVIARRGGNELPLRTSGGGCCGGGACGCGH